MVSNKNVLLDKRTDNLFEKIAELIEQVRTKVVTAVNTAEVYTKYCIGQFIVENEQEGQERATYGKAILKELSTKLTNRFDSGWSVENLTLFRKFYLIYSLNSERKIVNSVYDFQREERCFGRTYAT